MPKINKANIRLIIQTVIILGVVLWSYAPSLDSFFVADDIWQVNFAHKVFEGRTELIWRNFTSNYLQLPSFDFYRPLLGFTFLFDYFFYGTNAIGYHVTSLLLYLSAIALIFTLVRAMTRTWPDYNSSWAAFFSAILFAVTPLHCEDVTWISGRADLLAAPFYLLSFLLFIKSHQNGGNRRFYFFSLVCFALALLSKEIAIGLPVVVAAYAFIWPEEEKFGMPRFKQEKLLEKQTDNEALKKDGIEKGTKTGSDESAPQKSQGKAASARQVAHYERAVKKGKKKKKKKQSASTSDATGSNSSKEDQNDLGEIGSADSGSPGGVSGREASASAVKGDGSDKGGSGGGSAEGTVATGGEAVSTAFGAGWTFMRRLTLAVKLTWPFGIIGIIYLLIRLKVLGTFIGGYGGMLGGALERHLVLRWFDPINIFRILLPFPASISPGQAPQWILLICLATCVCIILLRLLAQARPFSWLLFLSIWMITAILPLAKLWGVGLELETSRLLFFFTMAYSILWPVLLFHPPRAGASYTLPAEANRNIGIVSAAVFLVMISVMAWASFRTNCFWYTAGHELRKIWRDTVDIAQGLNKNEKAIVLGIPKDYKGAHVNFNGSTFHHMLRPPFTRTDLSERILTFEPFIIGPFEVINSQRLKTLMNTPGVKGPFVWNREENRFRSIEFGGKRDLPETLELPFRITNGALVGKSVWKYLGKGTSELKGNGIVMHNTDDGANLQIPKLDISPMEFDFLEFTIRGALKPKDLRALVPMAIGWNSMSVKKDRYENWSVNALHVEKLKEKNIFRLQLSHFWQYFSAGTIRSFVIRFFEADTIEVSDVHLVKGDKLLPFAGVKDLKQLTSGEHVIGNDPVVFLFDGTKIPNANSVEIEITKPNFFFDNYLMGTKESAGAHILGVNLVRGATILKPELFPDPAYYEIRVRCLDANKQPVGVWSEAVAVVKMGAGLDTYLF